VAHGAGDASKRASRGCSSLHSVQHILDANRLTWSGVGHHPDCQFASFIHASQQREPTWDLIIATRRKCRNWLSLKPPEKQKRHGSAYHQEAPLFSQGASAALVCGRRSSEHLPKFACMCRKTSSTEVASLPLVCCPAAQLSVHKDVM
jgi:hypothetical protein